MKEQTVKNQGISSGYLARPRAPGVLLTLVLSVSFVSACQSAVPPATDEEIMAQWDDIPAQCMGYDDPEAKTYRTFGVDDPNPKELEPCKYAGGTAPGGHCNVPCGYVKLGDPIGNKNCECGSGFFVNCVCLPLPSVADEIPEYVGSCEEEEAAPEEYSQERDDTFADHMHLSECSTEFAACITPDLPLLDETGSCAWTTPKGCLCLGGRWQCSSTNSWFTCRGDDCPQSYQDIAATNGNLKNSILCTQ